MTAPPPKVIRYCRCGMPAFEYDDGAFRCLVNHIVAEDVDAAFVAELGGDAA